MYVGILLTGLGCFSHNPGDCDLNVSNGTKCSLASRYTRCESRASFRHHMPSKKKLAKEKDANSLARDSCTCV